MTKTEAEEFKEMMDRCIERWDIVTIIKVDRQRCKALEEFVNSKLKDDATLSDDDFSYDASFFSSEDENKFDCMNDDVFLPNIRDLTVEKPCSTGLVTCECVTTGPCMPYLGKWIDVGETAMSHFSVAQNSDLATATENIFSKNLIAISSHHGILRTGSQHTDQFGLTRTSSEDNCEKLQESFVTFPTENAYRELAKFCESKAARANADRFSEESTEEKLTTPAEIGGNFVTKIWKENAINETDKQENEDSNVATTVGGSDDTIQEGGTFFGTLRQHLAPAIFKKPENQSYDAEIAVTDESVFENVLNLSTAELVIFDAFVKSLNGTVVGSHDMFFGLVQMKFEKPERKKNGSLNLEPQLLHSDEKNLAASFSYAGSDGILQSEQTVQNVIEQSLILRQRNVSFAEEVFSR